MSTFVPDFYLKVLENKKVCFNNQLKSLQQNFSIALFTCLTINFKQNLLTLIRLEAVVFGKGNKQTLNNLNILQKGKII